jgi:hypothetical protein
VSATSGIGDCPRVRRGRGGHGCELAAPHRGQRRARPRCAVPVQEQLPSPHCPRVRRRRGRHVYQVGISQSRHQHPPHSAAGQPHNKRLGDSSAVTVLRQAVLAHSPRAARERRHGGQGAQARQSGKAERRPGRAVPVRDDSLIRAGAADGLGAAARLSPDGDHAPRREHVSPGRAGRLPPRRTAWRWARSYRRLPR